MEHLCLIYFEGQALDASMDEAFAYDEVLRKGGHYPVSRALQPNLSDRLRQQLHGRSEARTMIKNSRKRFDPGTRRSTC